MDNKCSCRFTCTALSCVDPASPHSVKTALVMWLPALWIINNPYLPKRSSLKIAICNHVYINYSKRFIYGFCTLSQHVLGLQTTFLLREATALLPSFTNVFRERLGNGELVFTLLVHVFNTVTREWVICICKFVSGGSFVFPRVSRRFVYDSSETLGTWRSISSPEGQCTCQRTAWREHSSSARTKD